MRSSKAICLALAALDVLVFAAQLFPRGGDELKARVSNPARSSKADAPRGAAVPFRPAGDIPGPIAAPEKAPVPAPSAPLVDAPIDSSAFAYLGAMTSSDGKAGYFFKSRATNRVYSAGLEDSEIQVLGASEKEFLIEIDGSKYKVAR
jgi:hypothetical protein